VRKGTQLDDDDKTQQALSKATEAAFVLGEQCAKYRDGPTFEGIKPLGSIINSLMTELWDQQFSKTDIREAFESAIQDMDRYAAGQERRS
jgi:hypothetical protein